MGWYVMGWYVMGDDFHPFHVYQREPWSLLGGKYIVAIIELKEGVKHVPISLVSTKVARVLWKKKTNNHSLYAKASGLAWVLCQEISQRPLSYQVALAEGGAALKAWVAELAKELGE